MPSRRSPVSPIDFDLKSGSVQVSASEQIVLAHEPDFVLGRLRVSPARRELVRDDGAREILEHRVMQVLVALAKAEGSILTRDELTVQCWEGRVVGEDAINRVISHLRKAGNGIGAGSFEIETITKIGYRLTGNSADGREGLALILPKQPARREERPKRLSRRSMMIGAAAAGAAAVTTASLLLNGRPSRPTIPEEARLLMGQGVLALEHSSPDANDDGIAAFQRVVEIAPDYADGWGMLAYAYGFACHTRERSEAAAMRARAQAAARHAFALDPGNVDGQLAMAVARPFMGQWLERERGFRHALGREPDNKNALRLLAVNLIFVGRASDAVPLYSRIGRPLAPSVYANYLEALWNAGRLEEADRAAEEARSLYPSDPMIWARRYHMLQFGGHPQAAVTMLQETNKGAQELDEADARELKIARALESRDAIQSQSVIDDQMRLARLGSGYAREAILVANALGYLDEAFQVAEAYYFGRGFVVPDRQTPTAIFYAPPNERHTRMLFDPVSGPMRADPRFPRLVDELGLERYWRDTGSQPDYRRA